MNSISHGPLSPSIKKSTKVPYSHEIQAWLSFKHTFEDHEFEEEYLPDFRMKDNLFE